MNRVLFSFPLLALAVIFASSIGLANEPLSLMQKAQALTRNSSVSPHDPSFVRLIGTAKNERKISIQEMIEIWKDYDKATDSSNEAFAPKIFLHSAISATAGLLIQQNRLPELQILLKSELLVLVKPASVFEEDLALSGMNLIEVAIIARNPYALRLMINYAKSSQQNHDLLMVTNPAVAQALFEHPSLQQVLNDTGTPFSQWTALQFRWSRSLMDAVTNLKYKKSQSALAKVIAIVLPFYGNSLKTEISGGAKKVNSGARDFLDLFVDEQNESVLIEMVEKSSPTLWQRIVGRRRGNRFLFDNHQEKIDVINVSADGKTRTIKILIRNSRKPNERIYQAFYQELSLIFNEQNFLSQMIIKNGASPENPDFERSVQSAKLDSIYHSTRQNYRMLESVPSMRDYLPLLDFKQRYYKPRN